MTNINGTSDPFYRYKMHEVECVFERNKTLFVNVAVVAKDLARPVDQLIKYIGYDLGTKSQIERDSGQGSFAGKHSTTVIQNSLNSYIESFVLCPKCNNPETEIIIEGKKKHQILLLSCKACGAVTQIHSHHPIYKYIINQGASSAKVEASSAKASTKSSKYEESFDDLEWYGSSISDKDFR